MRVRTPPWALFQHQILDERGVTPKQAALEMDWKLSIMEEFLDGKLPVSRGIAQDLGDYVGTGWEMWLNLQDNYDKSIGFN